MKDIRQILTGFFLGVLTSAVVYEFVDREKPEWLDKFKSWVSGKPVDDLEPEEAEAEENLERS
ncbi:MAG: hypothetical protein HQK55_02965 [Deltaproteobacteria bacterium]|nr:hypothetical protein [Deltaproteobacteria bacterium]